MIFHRKCCIGIFLGWNLEKSLSFLESVHLNFFFFFVSCNKENSYIYDKKCQLWVILVWNLKKKYFHIWNQLPQIFLVPDFDVKNLRKKFLNWVFLGWNFSKVLSYLISTTSNLCNSIFWCKRKVLKLGTKNAWFRCFGAKI